MDNPFSFSRPARPAYLDGLFGTTQAQHNQYRPRTPSLSRSHHSSDSIASLASARANSIVDYATRPLPSTPRTLSPAFEEEVGLEPDWNDEVKSIQSTARANKPRLRLRTSLPLLSRRTPQQRQQRPGSDGSVATSPSIGVWQHRRKDSGPPSSPPNKPLPALPVYAQVQPQPKQLNSMRCYYFAARNCKNWVMGGRHGDACDMCCQAGHMGSP